MYSIACMEKQIYKIVVVGKEICLFCKYKPWLNVFTFIWMMTYPWPLPQTIEQVVVFLTALQWSVSVVCVSQVHWEMKCFFCSWLSIFQISCAWFSSFLDSCLCWHQYDNPPLYRCSYRCAYKSKIIFKKNTQKRKKNLGVILWAFISQMQNLFITYYMWRE